MSETLENQQEFTLVESKTMPGGAKIATEPSGKSAPFLNRLKC